LFKTKVHITHFFLYPSFCSSADTYAGDCATCHHRALNQKKYLDQVDDLYEDFHVIKLPLQLNEVRGVEAIKEFSKMLLEPFDFANTAVKAEK
jgi:anion-transporting  ArsA/GET3 family ATPase